ncbi:Trm112p-like_protein [Hexamita inflata]|uniref:Trm112p-like_protein n=1 Tax=Hexamita inflata TaxID=28002 RepID=A0ABP1HFW8_9EUKA
MVLIMMLTKTTCANKEDQPDFEVFDVNIQDLENVERDFNPDLLKVVNFDTEYHRVLHYANILQISMPENLPENWQNDEQFLSTAYEVLFCKEIINGEVRCPKCERCYQIKNRVLVM